MAIESSLVVAAGLMGLAGSPHCAAMCAAPCAVLTGRGAAGGRAARLAAFGAGRLLGYAAGGAAVAGSVALLARLTEAAPALRSLWLLLQLAVLGLGLGLLVRGRPPAWWARLGSVRAPVAAGGWQHLTGPLRAGAAGSLWLAWPCGLLQSALLVAALADTPGQGAAAMAAFAATSSLGLWLPGLLWRRLPGATAGSWRLAGAALVTAAGFALGHGLWERVAAFCAVP